MAKGLLNKNQEAKILWARRAELEIHNNKLFLKKNGTTHLVVPSDHRKETVKKYHEHHCHIGIQKTLSLIKMRFFWPRMEETVKDVINSCRLCSFNKQSASTNKAPLVSTKVGEPFERIAVDLTGPFLTTSKGNRYILGIIDHFSKFSMLIPVKDAARPVAKGGPWGARPPQEHEQAPPCAERDTDDEDNDK